MITSWILNSVNEEIRNNIVYMESARSIWIYLEVRYAQSNAPKLFNLRKDISRLSQGSLSISAYFTKFRTIHDELESMTVKTKCVYNNCTCGVNAKLSAVDQSTQITQFLMGLNDSYTAIRGQVLLMTPVPTLSQTYAILLQEESQREVHNSVSGSVENMAMAVKSYPAKSQNRFSQNKKSTDSSVICDYCHMTGHLKEKCYCIHGYPSWHKLFGKPKPKPKYLTPRNSVVASVTQVPAVTDNNMNSSGESVSACLQVSHGTNLGDMNLSENQCQQIIQMLQKSIISTQSASSSNSGNTPYWSSSNTGNTPNWSTFHCANTVQTSVRHFVSQVHNVTDVLSQCKWIIDTGATDHITPFISLLSDVHPSSASLQLPNGEISSVTHVGNITLNSQITLTNVLCVPSFSYNLLSISKLLQDSSCQVTFLSDTCYLQGQNLKTSLEIGKQENGLYILTDNALQGSESLATVKTHKTHFQVTDDFHFNAHVSSIDTWHARLGHAPAHIVQLLPVKSHNKVLDTCDSCFFAKQSRLSFTDSVHSSANLFDLVHADLWGPYRFKTHDNCSWFLSLVEDKSRVTWVYLLPDKTVVSSLLQEFIIHIQNQFGTVIKTLRTDNETEFFNNSVSTFLKRLGIVHQSSCAYSPQQNGLVERKHRHLLNCARALRFHAGLPIIFWGDCILTAAYLINRTPTKVLNNKSPYEVLFHTAPDYKLLKVFGALCYATVLPKPSDKFAAKAVKGVFLGYPYGQKGYKVLNLDTKKVFVSRDVHFLENVFPFKIFQVHHQHLYFLHPPSLLRMILSFLLSQNYLKKSQ